MEAEPTPLHDAAPVVARLAGCVLLGLLVAKALQHVPYLGPVVLSGAAFMQLYLPMWRCERLDAPYSAVGLDLRAWRRDAAGVALLMAAVLPLYALGLHVYLTQGHDALLHWGLGELARNVPRASWAPQLPSTLLELWEAVVWFVPMALTHVLGVALPEETFYRGYLQAQWEQRWPPTRRFWGTPVGQAAVLSAALFALGHFLGEWNPARFGPFFPALLFAWLRNRSHTVVGCVAFHGLCNIASEILFRC